MSWCAEKADKVVEMCRLEANSPPSAPPRQTIQFARAAKTIKTPCQKGTARLLAPGSKWSMRIDQLQFPGEIMDLLLWIYIYIFTQQ